jgi:hypothetical protein
MGKCLNNIMSFDKCKYVEPYFWRETFCCQWHVVNNVKNRSQTREKKKEDECNVAKHDL